MTKRKGIPGKQIDLSAADFSTQINDLNVEELTLQQFAEIIIDNIVDKSSDQTIGGDKTFASNAEFLQDLVANILDADSISSSRYKLSSLNTPPASSTATGSTGEIRFTSDYIYLCVATNSWKKVPLSFTDPNFEDGAEVNDTGAEIKIKYEGEDNTNAYTDAEKAKLGSIDATHYMPPVQSTANLTAIPESTITDKARTYVENEISDYFYDITAVSGDLAPDDQTGGTGFWRKVSSGGDTAASVKTKYESNPDTNAFTDTEQSKLAGIENNATADQTGAEIKTLYELESDTNAFTDLEKTKLGGIDDGAEVNPTQSEIKTLYESNLDTNAFTDGLLSKLNSITAIFTTSLKTSYDNAVTWVSTNGTNLINHLSNTSNPHSVDKTDVGLGNVPNLDTTDAINNEHTHSNKSVLDLFDGILKTSYDNAVSWISTNGANLLSHLIDANNPHNITANTLGLGDVPNLDTTDAVNNEHTHSNKSILDNIQQALTTSLKNAYDNVVTWVSTNGTNLINHLSNTSNPHNVTKEQLGLSNVPNTNFTNVILQKADIGYIELISLTTSGTVVSTHKGKLLSMNNSSAMTLTVNTGSLTLVGDFCYVDQEGAGEVTVVAGSGVTLKKNTSRQLKTDGQYSRICIQKVTTDSYRVFGELKQSVVLP